MKSNDRMWARMALALGVLSLIGLGVSVLALMDIGGGRESDLSLEWKALRAAFLVILMFHAAAIAAIVKHLRAAR